MRHPFRLQQGPWSITRLHLAAPQRPPRWPSSLHQRTCLGTSSCSELALRCQLILTENECLDIMFSCAAPFPLPSLWIWGFQVVVAKLLQHLVPQWRQESTRCSCERYGRGRKEKVELEGNGWAFILGKEILCHTLVGQWCDYCCVLYVWYVYIYIYITKSGS